MYQFTKRNKDIQKILFLPINKAISEGKLTWLEFAKELQKQGLKYTKSSLITTQQGKNTFAVHFSYYTKLYDALNLPDITLDYLIECREKYNKIKPQRRKKEINLPDL